ncbi:MAG: hypothetical protein M3044_09365 [Thermoproteota archaeon]|nr:hypothetical protein [Thermoproteota archaeon]
MSEKKGSECDVCEVCDDGNSASQRLKTRHGIENKEEQRNKSLRRDWTRRLHERYEVKTKQNRGRKIPRIHRIPHLTYLGNRDNETLAKKMVETK